MKRKKITVTETNRALKDLIDHLGKKVEKKGTDAFASCHEASGVLDEEVREFKDEIHANNHTNQSKELLDVAVAALWGYMSIKLEKVDW